MKKLMSILTAALFVFALSMSFSSCGDDATTGAKSPAKTGEKATGDKATGDKATGDKATGDKATGDKE